MDKAQPTSSADDGTQGTLNHLIQTPQKKYDCRHPKQVLVTETLVKFVANDLMPLSLVESDSFSDFVKSLDPCYQLPSRKHLSSNLLKKKHHQVKSIVLKTLEEAKALNLTIDLWSNRQMRSYIGITCHFITKKWELQSVMLACKRVSKKHTAENISMWYEEIMAEFNISRKIKHIVTDSASNMKKAFLTVLPGYDEDKTDTDDDDDDMESDDSEESNHSPLEGVTFTHHACFAHMMQLVIKDGLKNAGHLGSVIKRCSKLVSFLRKSTIATDILENEKRPQNENATRWNSQLKMIKSILSISDSKLSEIHDAPKLTAHEQNILQDIVSILAPFEQTSDFAQIECVPSSGYVIPCTLGLDHHLNSVTSRYNNPFVRGLKASFDRRLLYYLQNEVYILAAILDPRFKLRWCNNDEDKYQEALDILSLAVDRCYEMHKTDFPSYSEIDKDSEPSSKRRKIPLFSFMPEEQETNTQFHSCDDYGVNDYVKSPCASMEINPLQFWKGNEKKWPVISTLAMELLAVPASSAPVERLFSVAGKVFRPERCRLTDDRFELLRRKQW